LHVLPSFRYMPKSHTAGSYGSAIFSFLGTSTLITIVAALIYTPTSRVWGSLSPHFYQQMLLFDCHSNWSEMEFQRHFWFAFPLLLKMLNIFFMYLFTICNLSFENCLFNPIWPILINLIFCVYFLIQSGYYSLV
jgi:hypothetical protein